MPRRLPPVRWSLTPPFHPCPALSCDKARWTVLCGTLLGVSATGRYPASCSVELGLSSRCAGAQPAIARAASTSCNLHLGRPPGNGCTLVGDGRGRKSQTGRRHPIHRSLSIRALSIRVL